MTIKNKKNTEDTNTRPPVIVVMGHVDHGKSALLDYIRKTSIVENEAGGITQCVSAYEVTHSHEGIEKRITFLDTPGHEAFAAIRARGAHAADIAVLVVSAEEGVKPQTLDALSAIKAAHIPYVVAINKIDKPNADINRTKASLIEHEVYLEGMGGDIPYNEISAKTGEGVDSLLDTLLLVAELEELTGDPASTAEGVIIEANRNSKKGIAATLIIKNGTLKSGQYIVADTAMAPVRIFENFEGKIIKEATFSSPVRIIGFDSVPKVGSIFRSYDKKKNAELSRSLKSTSSTVHENIDKDDERHLIPLVIKADATGTLDAIEHELAKMASDRVIIQPLIEGVGAVSEGDIQTALASSHTTLVIAFNVSVDTLARDIAQKNNMEIHSFNIIYKMSEWLIDTMHKRTPKIEIAETLGTAKLLMYFSSMKNKHVVGGKVVNGIIKKDLPVRILRKKEIIGEGIITNLQSGKQNVIAIAEGDEFGAQVASSITLQVGDVLESYELVIK